MNIECQECGRVVGTMSPPGPAVLSAMVQGTPFAALAGLIGSGPLPADVGQRIAGALNFRCVDHPSQDGTDGSTEDDSKGTGEKGRSEANDTDASGEGRTVKRGLDLSWPRGNRRST